jgi:hypothetical protein
VITSVTLRSLAGTEVLDVFKPCCLADATIYAFICEVLECMDKRLELYTFRPPQRISIEDLLRSRDCDVNQCTGLLQH